MWHTTVRRRALKCDVFEVLNAGDNTYLWKNVFASFIRNNKVEGVGYGACSKARRTIEVRPLRGRLR